MAQALELPQRYRVGDEVTLWLPSPIAPYPHSERKKARVLFQGERSYILALADPDTAAIHWPASWIATLQIYLEHVGPHLALRPDLGVLELLEGLFGPLPIKTSPDKRLAIVLGNVANDTNEKYPPLVLYLPQDQIVTSQSILEIPRSNQQNILYVAARVNAAGIVVDSQGNPLEAEQLSAQIAEELPKLMTEGARDQLEPQKNWLLNVQINALHFLWGDLARQQELAAWAAAPGRESLLENSRSPTGIDLAFTAFLLDRLGHFAGLESLHRRTNVGRRAIEDIFHEQAGLFTGFDSLFSDFIDYFYGASGTQESLPTSWLHLRGNGVVIPPLTRSGIFLGQSVVWEGTVMPYGVTFYQLDREISSEATIRLEALGEKNVDIDLLWKPLPQAIAVYAVSTASAEPEIIEPIRYRLSITVPNPAMIAD